MSLLLLFGDPSTLYIANSELYNAAHAAQAESLLLYQFQDSDNLKAFLAALIDRVQEIEDALDPMIEARDLDNADTDRLDGIGAILHVSRSGRSDGAYRLRLRAEIKVNSSNGTVPDLVDIVALMAGTPLAPDVEVQEYHPRTVYIRPRNYTVTAPETFDALLQRAKAAGISLHFIYSSNETTDDNMFRFSDTAGTPETGVDHGFGTGTLCGVV